ncbi:DUF2975 domain-containing protein [Saccharibacillus sp. CPCC 101409]|uniref:DUF2975 domain-containing protein n=1 Tax=Saccharibacillus sp. CPCC 101409 TaxID=3058041 RepID=UPI002673F8D9|nr:DUF2975 domain-containing protein [Saccharibacillus sp. CPCC 101409]MDO3413276.1 DUF2975 domain-containing protein [Saccharibacillus sp. CPCC 101409]
MKIAIPFLQTLVAAIGLTVIGLCIFWLPAQAALAGARFPEFAYLKLPVLLGLYATAVPFLLAIHRAIRLLGELRGGISFPAASAAILVFIRRCALIIAALYIAGMAFLFTQSALHPGIVLAGLTIILLSLTVVTCAALLQKLLERGSELQRENELTI